MVVPTAASLADEKGWAVVVTFSDDGYVSDEDAASTDYAQLLAELKEGTKDENAERKRQGFETVDLVGWAVPPRYDAASKKFYWAKELAFEGNDQHTLNSVSYTHLDVYKRQQDERAASTIGRQRRELGARRAFESVGVLDHDELAAQASEMSQGRGVRAVDEGRVVADVGVLLGDDVAEDLGAAGRRDEASGQGEQQSLAGGLGSRDDDDVARQEFQIDVGEQRLSLIHI